MFGAIPLPVFCATNAPLWRPPDLQRGFRRGCRTGDVCFLATSTRGRHWGLQAALRLLKRSLYPLVNNAAKQDIWTIKVTEAVKPGAGFFLFFLKCDSLEIFFIWQSWVVTAVCRLSLTVEWGPISTCGVRASYCHGPSRCGADLVVAEQGLSSCGSHAYLLHCMWNLPRPGIEPESPALASGFLTIGPRRKSWS